MAVSQNEFQSFSRGKMQIRGSISESTSYTYIVGWEEAISWCTYAQKLKYYCSVEDVQIRSNPRNAHDMRAQVEDEDKAVMNLVRSDDWVVMLDERGRDIGSEQMAELAADAGHTGASRLSFCIGGPYDHGRKL